MAEAITEDAAWYCWHASRRQAMLEASWEKAGAFVHQQIIWVKDRGVLTRSHYLWKHEPCFMGWVRPHRPPKVADETLASTWVIPSLNGEERPDHPTPKPLDCFAIPMRQHVARGGICYEPFSGSGSQIMAGESTGRRVFAMEISPAYVDVAVERWQAETGREAVLDGHGRSFAAVKAERLGAAAPEGAAGSAAEAKPARRRKSAARVLVACEFSGVVHDAFRARGHDAVSCDLLPSERPGQHIVGDVRDILHDGWDLLIAHPPCTFLANSGAKHLYLGCRRENGAAGDRWANLGHAAAFFLAMLRAPIPRIAVENPIMLGHVRRLFDLPAPSQTIQPWHFGHPETKATCLWLKGLPRLVPTSVVAGREARVHREPPGPERWRNRSRTYPGIAAAMAEQWGGA